MGVHIYSWQRNFTRVPNKRCLGVYTYVFSYSLQQSCTRIPKSGFLCVHTASSRALPGYLRIGFGYVRPVALLHLDTQEWVPECMNSWQQSCKGILKNRWLSVCRAYRRVAPGDPREGTSVYAGLAGELQQDTHGKVPVGIYSLQQGRD